MKQAGRLTRSEVQRRMPDSESFEAFYARTVGNVTSQMHALAEDDTAADHAIREAYARAYQQWYEVASYPDPEGWVLIVAREAFQRRQPAASAAVREPALPGHDPLSMPGMFREPAVRSASGGTGDTTLAPPVRRADGQENSWFTPAPESADAAEASGGRSRVRGISGLFGGRAGVARSATTTAQPDGELQELSERPTDPGGLLQPGHPSGPGEVWQSAQPDELRQPAESAAPARPWPAASPWQWQTAQPATPDVPWQTAQPATPGAPWQPTTPGAPLQPAGTGGAWPPEQPAERGERRRPAPSAGFLTGRSRTSVILLSLVVVLALGAAAGVGYLVAGSHPGSPRAASSRPAAAAHHSSSTSKPEPRVQMLAAGQTGSLNAIPWSLVGTGWTLAEVSTAAPASNGTASAGGTVTTYLVDPLGGKYQIQTAAGPVPALVAWSGNGRNALFEVPPGSSGTAVSYELLNVMTGSAVTLPLPAGVTAVGFTRPDGLDILGVRQTATAFKLERFNLEGTFQAAIGTLPVKSGITPASWQACGTSCGALSAPTGLTAVWGVGGDEMQVVWNNAAGLVRRLAVPDSGSPSSCVPVSWWNTATVLASCAVTGQSDLSRLWLVPVNGATPTPLTSPSGSASGVGADISALQAAGAVYVNSTDVAQCPSAASGQAGLRLATVSGGSLQQVKVSGTTNNRTSVLSASGGRLLLLAETSCPGTSSLLWLNASTGATQTVLSAPASEVGVVAAAPFGLGPAAISVALAG